jgi:hypothetical protein
MLWDQEDLTNAERQIAACSLLMGQATAEPWP